MDVQNAVLVRFIQGKDCPTNNLLHFSTKAADLEVVHVDRPQIYQAGSARCETISFLQQKEVKQDFATFRFFALKLFSPNDGLKNIFLLFRRKKRVWFLQDSL